MQHIARKPLRPRRPCVYIAMVATCMRSAIEQKTCGLLCRCHAFFAGFPFAFMECKHMPYVVDRTKNKWMAKRKRKYHVKRQMVELLSLLTASAISIVNWAPLSSHWVAYCNDIRRPQSIQINMHDELPIFLRFHAILSDRVDMEKLDTIGMLCTRYEKILLILLCFCLSSKSLRVVWKNAERSSNESPWTKTFDSHAAHTTAKLGCWATEIAFGSRLLPQ